MRTLGYIAGMGVVATIAVLLTNTIVNTIAAARSATTPTTGSSK